MKKRIFLFTAIAALGYVSLTSNQAGPAAVGGLNRTGAKASGTNCSAGGCHSSAAGPAVTITVDSGSALTPVTHYKPGMAYVIKLHGAGSTNTKFGFQFASVSGTGSSQVQAGVVSGTTGAVASHLFSSLNIIEQTAALAATSAGVYDVSFTWTAPATAVGNITLYCTINSVNGDGTDAGSGDVSGNTLVTLTPTASTTAVANVGAEMSIIACPNPATSNMNLQLNNAQPGTYAVEVFNLAGKVIAVENISVNSTNQSASINSSNWAPGTYMISVAKDGNRNVIPVVKQ
ncbi:MAG: hypothetical protein JWQ38_650 [Flavipsychrobacter sp.]|nr:hypothetical protein [Flavipsychrobacter sp.]